MPILNGIKVACEPCIRGHRSTKCTHAPERVMVPVRKPGRPLSACPHPSDQPCHCGHVTAAIPRKQSCACPDDNTSDSQGPSIIPAYRIQKTSSSRPGSSRRLSGVDPSAFERMNMADYNVSENNNPFGGMKPQPYMPDRRSLKNFNHAPPINQRTYPDGTVRYMGNGGQPLSLNEKAAGQTVDGRPLPSPEELGDIWPRLDMSLDLANDDSLQKYMMHGHEHIEMVQRGLTADSYRVPLTAPPDSSQYSPFKHILLQGEFSGQVKVEHQTPFSTPGSSPFSTAQSIPSTAIPSGAHGSKPQATHSHSSSSASSFSEPRDHCPDNDIGAPVVARDHGPGYDIQYSMYSAPKAQQQMASAGVFEVPMQPSMPINNFPPTLNTQLSQNGHYASPPIVEAFAQGPLYASTIVGPSTFSYPANYGSYQNPMRTETWRQNIQPTGMAPSMRSTFSPTSFDVPETIHECCCGDGCECLGCAAHPYNDSTQEYVRRAYELQNRQMDITSPVSATETSGVFSQQHGLNNENMRSPTSSANGDELNLSSENYFFVDYDLGIGDGCGGDTMTCPCGNDCQCIGCSIHKPFQQQNFQQAPPTPLPEADMRNGNGGSCCAPQQPLPEVNKASRGGGSCCAPPPLPSPPEIKSGSGSCCSKK